MAKPVKHRDKWRIRWSDENGVRQSEVFDKFKDAEFALRRHQNEVDEVERGLRCPAPPQHTFSEICDYWLEKRAPRKRRPKDDECIIRVHLLPAFRNLKVQDIGVEHVDEYLASHLQLNRKTVSNHLTLLISMLNAALDLGWLRKLPRIKKPKIALFSSDFQYLRTEEEIAKLLRSALDEGELVFVLYATAVNTGLRQGELGGLRWEDVDFERRLITVQRSFNGPTKAGDVRYVPILDSLLPILRDWRLKCPGQLVFPNQAGKMQRPSARVFKDTFYRVLDRTDLSRVERNGQAVRYIRFHDLRHTFASRWVINGGDIFKLQKILGHKSMAMTMRYAHLAPHAFVVDYSRFGVPIFSNVAKVASICRLP